MERGVDDVVCVVVNEDRGVRGEAWDYWVDGCHVAVLVGGYRKIDEDLLRWDWVICIALVRSSLMIWAWCMVLG